MDDINPADLISQLKTLPKDNKKMLQVADSSPELAKEDVEDFIIQKSSKLIQESLELIDNMLIVNPPKEEISLTETTTDTSSNNILDVDYLEFEDLDVDYLAQDDLEFNELDINYLDVNFLEDLLNIIEDINELDQTETLLQADLDLKGTSFGFDAETQINTFTTDNTLTFYKALEDTVRIDLDKSASYTVILVQNGKSTQIIVNGGSSSKITIKQSS